MCKLLLFICFISVSTIVTAQAKASASVTANIISGVGIEKESDLEMVAVSLPAIAYIPSEELIAVQRDSRATDLNQKSVINIVNLDGFNFSVLLPKPRNTFVSYNGQQILTTSLHVEQNNSNVIISANKIHLSGTSSSDIYTSFPLIVNYD